jgi:hypothetical protein
MQGHKVLWLFQTGPGAGTWFCENQFMKNPEAHFGHVESKKEASGKPKQWLYASW